MNKFNKLDAAVELYCLLSELDTSVNKTKYPQLHEMEKVGMKEQWARYLASKKENKERE